jgi:chromosome segregation ATPase
MTTPDDLPGRVEALEDLIHTVFGREIEKGRKALAALNADDATTRTTLSELQAQLKSARDQLSSVKAYLGRGSTLASLDHKIAEDRKTLEALNARIEKATTAATAAEEKLAEVERKLTEETTALQDVRAERDEAIATKAGIVALTNNFPRYASSKG